MENVDSWRLPRGAATPPNERVHAACEPTKDDKCLQHHYATFLLAFFQTLFNNTLIINVMLHLITDLRRQGFTVTESVWSITALLRNRTAGWPSQYSSTTALVLVEIVGCSSATHGIARGLPLYDTITANVPLTIVYTFPTALRAAARSGQ